MIRIKVTRFGKYTGPVVGDYWYWGAQCSPRGILIITLVDREAGMIGYEALVLYNNNDNTVKFTQTDINTYKRLVREEYWFKEEQIP